MSEVNISLFEDDGSLALLEVAATHPVLRAILKQTQFEALPQTNDLINRVNKLANEYKSFCKNEKKYKADKTGKTDKTDNTDRDSPHSFYSADSNTQHSDAKPGDGGERGDGGDGGERGDGGDGGERGDAGDGGERGDEGDGGESGSEGDGGDGTDKRRKHELAQSVVDGLVRQARRILGELNDKTDKLDDIDISAAAELSPSTTPSALRHCRKELIRFTEALAEKCEAMITSLKSIPTYDDTDDLHQRSNLAALSGAAAAATLMENKKREEAAAALARKEEEENRPHPSLLVPIVIRKRNWDQSPGEMGEEKSKPSKKKKKKSEEETTAEWKTSLRSQIEELKKKTAKGKRATKLLEEGNSFVTLPETLTLVKTSLTSLSTGASSYPPNLVKECVEVYIVSLETAYRELCKIKQHKYIGLQFKELCTSAGKVDELEEVEQLVTELRSIEILLKLIPSQQAMQM
eukprot:GHVN01024708.1.p1 GENE.GHVN01024708.1~~GHVN01024708.1.p1  ORF type:complete len:464 (+),score=157.21 GHVN01024708.1:47-1438(+)